VLKDFRPSVQTQPGELSPVLVVVVEEQGDAGVAFDVAQPGEPGGPLRLFVDRDHKAAINFGETDNHQVRRTIRVERRETSNAREFDQVALPRFEFNGHTVIIAEAGTGL